MLPSPEPAEEGLSSGRLHLEVIMILYLVCRKSAQWRVVGITGLLQRPPGLWLQAWLNPGAQMTSSGLSISAHVPCVGFVISQDPHPSTPPHPTPATHSIAKWPLALSNILPPRGASLKRAALSP